MKLKEFTNLKKFYSKDVTETVYKNPDGSLKFVDQKRNKPRPGSMGVSLFTNQSNTSKDESLNVGDYFEFGFFDKAKGTGKVLEFVNQGQQIKGKLDDGRIVKLPYKGSRPKNGYYIKKISSEQQPQTELSEELPFTIHQNPAPPRISTAWRITPEGKKFLQQAYDDIRDTLKKQGDSAAESVAKAYSDAQLEKFPNGANYNPYIQHYTPDIELIYSKAKADHKRSEYETTYQNIDMSKPLYINGGDDDDEEPISSMAQIISNLKQNWDKVIKFFMSSEGKKWLRELQQTEFPGWRAKEILTYIKDCIKAGYELDKDSWKNNRLKENKDKTFKSNLFRSLNKILKHVKKQSVDEGIARGPKEKKLYELLEAWLGFISLKATKIPKDAIDSNGYQELKSMQQHYLGPVLNGMPMGEIINGDLWQNPKVIPHLLKYIYQGIPYIEERIKKFVKPNEQQNYLSDIGGIAKIKRLYKEAVGLYSQGQQGVTERLDELSNELLGRYKKAAGADAREADKRGDYKRGDKRFSGILKATDKEFKNALRGMKEDGNPDLPGAPPGVKIMTPQEFVAGKQEVEEETKLPAPTRELKGQELTDYLDRIRGKEKKKTDKYKLPYIHRSDVVKYYSADGNRYDVDAIKAAISQRPAKLLKKNEKMRHSDGTYEQFFNVGFAALVGLALDESTGELVVVNTCPGAGSCKIDCFAMKGGKVQFAPAWMSDSRILSYLLNDPDGFFAQLKSEILAQVKAGAKKDIKVSIRWHDAGDFFSTEYVDMAFKLARELPMVDFYAYTKIGGVAAGDKPANFMINWSEGAHPSQERIVKKDDPSLEATKNSRIVPSKLFYDLLVKDEKKNLVKGPEGQWQVVPEKLPELKQRLAGEYGISANSILSYNEWDSKVRGRDKTPLKYNVIIAPGEPDITAKDPGVLSTLLLKH